MSHCMVDLETVDNVPTAGIISIGAVMFGRAGIGDKFYIPVEMESSLALGLTVSDETIDWWMRQSPEAQAVFTDPTRVAITEALSKFAKFLPHDVRLWGNGASFDNAILATAYRLAKMPPPWKFWNDRCYRTVVAGLAKREQGGTYHNALDDAISQAKHLIQVNPGAIR